MNFNEIRNKNLLQNETNVEDRSCHLGCVFVKCNDEYCLKKLSAF